MIDVPNDRYSEIAYSFAFGGSHVVLPVWELPGKRPGLQWVGVLGGAAGDSSGVNMGLVSGCTYIE